MNNNYSAPASTLVNRNDTAASLEAAMAGDYDFGVMSTLSEAWDRLKGIKRYILGAGILLYIVITAVMGIMTLLMPGMTREVDALHALVAQVVVQVALLAIVMPFAGGIVIMTLKHIQGREVGFGDLFGAFGKTLPLFLAAVLINLLVSLGFLLLIIPGIYLTVAYLLVVPLIIDRDLGVWEAMEASRRAISKRWFSVFGLYLLLMVIVLVSMIPLGIGLIWSMPLMAVSFMVMYRKMFGIASY